MADGHITVAPDSTGKSLQTFENTIGGEDVHAEAVVLVDENGEPIATLPVSGTFFQATQPVSGTVNLAAGTNNIGDVDVLTLPSLPAGSNAVGKLAANDGVDIGDVTINNSTGAAAVNIQDGGNTITVDGTVNAAQSGTWTVQPGNTANTTAWKVDGSAVTQPVSIAATVATKETRSATGTTSQVADNAASVTLLASNANRLGASITNDSSARLYVKTGTTASATDYTVSLGQHDSWEVPFGYTGRIDGIWATDPSDGAARITEYT